MAQTYDSRRLRHLRDIDRQLAEQHRQLALAIVSVLALYAVRNSAGERIVPNLRRTRDAIALAIWTQAIKPFYVGAGDAPLVAGAGRSPYAQLLVSGVEGATRLQVMRQVALLNRLIDDEQVLLWLTGQRSFGGDTGGLLGSVPAFYAWRDPAGFVLADRIMRVAVDVRMRVSRLLEHHIPQGVSLAAVGELLAAYLTPGAKGLPRNAPYGVEGGFAARRLLRNEVIRAAGVAAVAASAANPLVGGVQWLLSASHKCCDMCDSYAQGGANGDGVYAPESVPGYPPHVGCACRLQPVAVSNPASVVAGLRSEIAAGTPRARSLRGLFNPAFLVNALMTGVPDEVREGVGV